MPQSKKTPQTSSAVPRQNLPHDGSLSTPEGFFAEATALFNAGKISLDLYKQLQASSQTPFEVRITGSALLGKHHHVSFKCKNNTFHGLYLESLTIALPEKRDSPLDGVEIEEKPEPVSYGSQPAINTPIERWFPRYIAQGQELGFTLRFPVLTQSIHEQVPYLVGTFTVSHLNEKNRASCSRTFESDGDDVYSTVTVELTVRKGVVMPRALQSASLSFGLVTIPVKLYTAAVSKSVSFHLLHKKDLSRIHEQMICIAEDKPVARDELVKGYEVKRGRYIEVTDEDLDTLEAEVNRQVEIQEFVPLAAIDPVYFKKTYYLEPDNGGKKPYQLLAQAMNQERKAAIAQFVQRGKEELVMVRPVGQDRLMLHVLYYADEVRTFDAPAKATASDKEVELAVQLIQTLSSQTWQSSKYRDAYRERVLALIKKKETGEKVSAPKAVPSKGQVVDLMSALKQSLAASSEKRSKHRPGVKTRRKRSRCAA